MFEELWNFIQEHYAARRYHLVLGNIQLLIPLFNQQLLRDPTYVRGTLESLQEIFIQIDALAHEFHFRDYLHRYFITPIYQRIKTLDAQLAEAFINHLQLHIPRSDVRRVAHAKYEHTFQAFYNVEDKDPDKQLRLARGQRIALLEANLLDNQYAVWSDIVLSYLDAQLCAGQVMSEKQLTAVLNCLDALLTKIVTASADEVVVEELWHDVFIAQRLLSNSLAQASLGQELSSEMISHCWQANLSQAAGLFLLPVIAQAIALHGEENCAAWYTLAQQINIQLTTFMPQSQTVVFANHLLELQTMRSLFKELPTVFNLMTPQALVKAQQQFTQDTLSLLSEFVKTVAALLGEAPCDFALCALGSTSREDRRPYSDVELMLLYVPKPNVNLAQLQTYIYYLVSGVEYLIKQCGESHRENADPNLLQAAGFHLDDSSHLLKKELLGTPKIIAKKFIVEIAQSWHEQGHPWLDDESFYSLLSPVLINSDTYGGEQVLNEYKKFIQNYLNEVLSTADQIPTLTQALNLTASLSFNGLKRREMIALSCLYDVVQKSKALLITLKPGEMVDDIKRAFYKPLTYLALNLKLFHGLNAKHPAEIFAEATRKLSWGESQVLQLLQTALSYITSIQVKLHLQHGHQEERSMWLGHSTTNSEVSVLSAEEYAGLSLIKDSLLLPLCQWLEVQLNKNQSFTLLEVLPYLLKSYLTKRNELWLNQWAQHASHPLKFSELLVHPLISILANCPSPNGWSPTYEQAMCRWLSQLQSLVHEAKSACLIEGVPTGQPKVNYLPQEIVAQLFDAKGEFKGNVHHSAQSKVSKITWPIPGHDTPTAFYFKVKANNEAGLMGREFAVINLHQLLGGQSHIALGWPLKLTYLTAKGSKIYYCWVSEEVPGNSLTEVMQNQPAFELINTMLDKQSYSHLFITHYLTCPEDAQPDNFKVDPTYEGTFKLYGLDVGQSFVGTHDKKRKVLCVKTMLYLLEPAINQALDESVLTRLMLLEPTALIKYWQANIKRMNQLFQPLFEVELAKTRVPKVQWSLHNQLVDLNELVQMSMQRRLELLVNWLYCYPRQAKSGAVLLRALEPAVALSYQSLRGRIKTPEDFYKIDPKAYVKNPNTGKMYFSTTYLQIQQQTLTPERLQASLDLGEEYFAGIDFKNIKDEQEQRYVLTLLQAAIKNKKSFSYLKLSGCVVISEKELFELLKKTPSLKELYLEDCPQFNLLTLFQLLSFKVNEKLVGLRWEHDVLCPHLNRISVTLAGKVHQFDIALTLAGRKQLVVFVLQKQQQVESYRKKLVVMLHDKDFTEQGAVAQNLGKLATQLPVVQVEAVVKALLDKLGDKYWNVGANARRLVKFATQLSEVQVNLVVKALLTRLRDDHESVQIMAVQSLGLLAAQLSRVHVEIIIKSLLDRLGDKNEFVRAAAVKSLAEFFSPAGSLQWLQTMLLQANESIISQLPNDNMQVNQTILFKHFSFLDAQTLLQVVPQVSKDWRRWQKVYLQQQAEQQRLQFILPSEEKLPDEDEQETMPENNFNHFLPQ